MMTGKPYKEQLMPPSKFAPKQLTPEERAKRNAEIVRMGKEGISQKDIADKFGLSRPVVAEMLRMHGIRYRRYVNHKGYVLPEPEKMAERQPAPVTLARVRCLEGNQDE